MLNELTGTIIFDRNGRRVGDCASTMLDTLRKTFPDLAVTHYGGAYELALNWIPLTAQRLTTVLHSDYEHIAFACFADDCDVNNEIGLHCKVSVCGFHFRRADCLVMQCGFSQELASTRRPLVMRVCDSWAQEFQAHSGHIHDLRDSSDQNQEGPYWFELIGKPLPPSKIKRNPVTGEEDVDVEQNPCHTHVVGTVDFTAAWTNYLGRDFLTYLGFSGAAHVVALVEDISHEVVVLSDSLIRVTLFEDPYGFDRPGNIERLWTFRRRLCIDEVAHRLDPRITGRAIT